jgi:hypothetical protein
MGNGLTRRNTGPESTKAETERFKARLKEQATAQAG